MSLREEITATDAGLRIWQQEWTILEITELICGAMKRRKVSRLEMAKRIGTSQSQVTRLLDGRVDKSFRQLVDMLTAMNLEVQIYTRKIHKHK